MTVVVAVVSQTLSVYSVGIETRVSLFEQQMAASLLSTGLNERIVDLKVSTLDVFVSMALRASGVSIC